MYQKCSSTGKWINHTMEYNTTEKMNPTTWVNVDESQTMTSKNTKLQKNAFNVILFMLSINIKYKFFIVQTCVC